MADIIGTLINRDPRYYVKNGEGLSVRLANGSDEHASFVAAELIDISVGGAKLKVAEPPHVKEALSVEIETVDPEQLIAVTGDVCWVSPSADGDWLFGCSFHPKVPASALDDFAVSGMLERREHARQPVSHSAKAERELDGRLIDVEILNYSRGGFSIRTDCQCEPGDRILLRLPTEDGREVEIPGKTQWRVANSDKFTNGCAFVRDQDFATMKRVFGHATKPHVRSSFTQRLMGRVATDRATSVNLRRLMVAAVVLCLLGGVGWAWSQFRSAPGERIAKTETQLVAHESTSDLTAKDGLQPTSGPGTTANDNAYSQPTRDEAKDVAVRADTDTVGGLPAELPRTSIKSESHAEEAIAVDQASRASSSSDAFRLWTDNTGRYRVVARLESVENDLVRLRKKNGEIARAPLNRLSFEDAEYVREWLSKSAEVDTRSDSLTPAPVDIPIE